MNVKKFELFMCCLGNGTTVCNKAVEECGDYKMVAHISDGGNIKLYVSENYIPAADMEKIKNVAATDREKFRKNFLRLSDIKQYTTILDVLPIKRLVQAMEDRRSLAEKLPELRDYYFSIA